MMIVIILVWSDYPLAGKTENEEKEKSFKILNFDAINQSSRQPLSSSLVFILSPKLQGSYFSCMLLQWRWESDPHSLTSIFKAQRHFFLGCSGISQALLFFLLCTASMRRIQHFVRGSGKRKGIKETLSSSHECCKVATNKNVRKEDGVCTIY